MSHCCTICASEENIIQCQRCPRCVCKFHAKQFGPDEVLCPRCYRLAMEKEELHEKD